MLVVEIEPGPSCAGGQAKARGHRDGRIAQRGENVPGCGDEKEEQRGWDEVKFEKKMELAGEGEIEEDEGDGEDDADDSLGEEVEGSDSGEGEAGEESGSSFYDPTHPPRQRSWQGPRHVAMRLRHGWGTRL